VSRNPEGHPAPVPTPAPRLQDVVAEAIRAATPEGPHRRASRDLEDVIGRKRSSLRFIEHAIFEQGHRGASFEQITAIGDAFSTHVYGIATAFHPARALHTPALLDAIEADRVAEGECAVVETRVLPDLDDIHALRRYIAAKEQELRTTTAALASARARERSLVAAQLRRIG
jgi:hypothetical protein